MDGSQSPGELQGVLSPIARMARRYTRYPPRSPGDEGVFQSEAGARSCPRRAHRDERSALSPRSPALGCPPAKTVFCPRFSSESSLSRGEKETKNLLLRVSKRPVCCMIKRKSNQLRWSGSVSE